MKVGAAQQQARVQQARCGLAEDFVGLICDVAHGFLTVAEALAKYERFGSEYRELPTVLRLDVEKALDDIQPRGRAIDIPRASSMYNKPGCGSMYQPPGSTKVYRCGVGAHSDGYHYSFPGIAVACWSDDDEGVSRGRVVFGDG